ncbi:tRNA (adenosine(37)-N6)-threonylcarbamoyltransferase complex ATPase subunit type 1 TsaE [Candidatus Uhrbacteria bacterium]|nr:tRNA (adenosine(37)-N6)-threonylcarbamoyltransferase complex ATPase subunit type 1 TsaE [Candidatus Uhrbacteria bacterium]
MKKRSAFSVQRSVSHSESETMEFAKEFAHMLRGGEVVLLDGELGSGKTTFVRGMARAFGIREPIRSPTFTLMHVHRVAHRKPQTANRRKAVSGRRLAVRQFVHVDAYRLRGSNELRAIGIEEYLGRKDTVVVIEWGEKARRLVEQKYRIGISFKHAGLTKRRIYFSYGTS